MGDREDPQARGSLKRSVDFLLGTLPGRITAVAGAIVAVAGALAVLVPGGPEERAGEFVRVDVEQQVSLAAYQGRDISAPRQCEGFTRPETAESATTLGRGNETTQLRLAVARPPLPVTHSLVQSVTEEEPRDDGAETTEPETSDDDTPETTEPETPDDGTADTTETERGIQEEATTLSAIEAIAPDGDEGSVIQSVQGMEFDEEAPGIGAAREIAAGSNLTGSDFARLTESAASALIGNVVDFVVKVRGLKDRCTYVSAELFDASTRTRLPVPFARPRDALFFVARTENDQTKHSVWVPRPGSPGSYFVRLELFDHEGDALNFDDQASFRVASG